MNPTNIKRTSGTAVFMVSTVLSSVHGQTRMGTQFSYQGFLKDGGTPANGTYDMEFTLYDAATDGTSLGVSCLDNVSVTNGSFTAAIDFGEGVFDGAGRWLNLRVRADTTAGNCEAAGGYTELSPRQKIMPAPYALALPGLRVEQDPGGVNMPNVIGGSIENDVWSGVVGATVFGGGDYSAAHYKNEVTGGFGTVSGGRDNMAGERAVVGGGHSNTASGLHGVISGGYDNLASGYCATVPGGYRNRAEGDYSFAGGRFGHAQHLGTFVWSDLSSIDPFESTGSNQFLVRSLGGVAINTNAPRGTVLTLQSANQWRWDIGTGYGDFQIGDIQNGLCMGVATEGAGAGTVRVWPKGGAETLIVGTPTAGDVLSIAPTGEVKVLSDRVIIKPDGRVGLGAEPAASFRLSVVGEAGKTSGGSWAVFSDARLKRNLHPMTGTLNRLLSLQGYEFEYTDEAVARRMGDAGTKIGLLAQDVEEVFPDWVGENEDGFKYVAERAHTALLIEALRDLRAEKDRQIAERDARIRSLESRNADLNNRLERLEKAVQSLVEGR